jgi:putative salt-induced outer membrane protein YdiY
MLLSLFLSVALAQDPAYDGTVKEVKEAEKPVTALSAELGGTFATGNAYILAFNGGFKGKHEWQANRFGFGAGVALNLAKVDLNGDTVLDDSERDNKLEFTSQRLFAGARYDRFFGTMNSLYVSGGMERDTFAGLEWRFNEQLGYSRVLVQKPSTDLDLEVGVAYAQENFKIDYPTTETNDDGTISDVVLPKAAIVSEDEATYKLVLDKDYIAGRVFLGFDHRFNDKVSIGDTVETFINFFDIEDFRLINNAYLQAKLSDKFSIKLSHLLMFDNQPVEVGAYKFKKVDQTTQITLVANIF